MTYEEYVAKWKNIDLGWQVSRRQEFFDDLRKITGAGLNQCVNAARIEDNDFHLTVERLRGNRPPEWRLRVDELEERLRRIESILNIS